MTVARSQIDEMVARLHASVGEPVFEGVTTPEFAPEPHESWIDLQNAVVALAAGADPEGRLDLASALLRAVLEQDVIDPANRLSPEAFTVIRDAAPDELAASLHPSRATASNWGGQRYLHLHAFSIPGPEGARWLGTLARADDMRTEFLLEDMAQGRLPEWSDADWSRPARRDGGASQ